MSEIKRRRKRISHQLPLVLVSGATLLSLSGCDGGGSDKSIATDRYTSLEDCKQDWGDTSQCKEDKSTSSSSTSSSGGSHFGRSYFYGPNYTMGERDAAQQRLGLRPSSTGFSNRAVGRTVTSVSRGGFGSSGRGFSGGG